MVDRVTEEPERSARVEIWLEGDDELISGRLSSPGAANRDFSGWAELFAVLEEWRRLPGPGAAPAPDRS